MPDLVAIAGSATANSFATEVEFEDYCDARLNASAYTSASVDDRVRALIEATRDLSALSFIGTRVNATQALSWPRADASNPDAPVIDTIEGDVLADFAEDEIPQRVIDATCELALQYLKAGTTDVAALDATHGVIRKKVDVLETEYAEPAKRAQGLSRYPRVWALVKPLLSAKAGGLSVVRS